MHAEDLLVDQRRNRQTIEAVGEYFPQLDPVASLALVIEAVDAIDGRTFVVSTQKEKVLRILDLVREKKAHSFKGHLSAVNIVSQEKIVGIWREATVLEQSEQVVVLTVHIA